MPPQTAFTLLCAALFASFTGAIYLALRVRKVHFSTLPDIVGLLDPKGVPSSDLLRMRSLPNARLKHAFDLSNTFVTHDSAVHKAFVRSAMALIQPSPSQWLDIAHSTSFLVKQSATVLAYSPQEVPYHVFIQRLTFKAIVASLFKVEPTELTDPDIDVVAKGINDLWQLSKVTTSGDPALLSSINSRLRKWLPDIENPLNLIIPTFETMWRVVAATIALVLRDEHARRALSEYLRSPSRSQFKLWPEDPSGPSVDSLIRESLRLHPPTRRISRALPLFPHLSSYLPPLLRINLTQIAVADVEAVHRNSHIWGPDVEGFDAFRHHPGNAKNLSKDQILSREQGMLAFGAGPLKCVAFNWAPQFVGIVVAAVLEGEGSILRVVEGPKVGGREGWDGWKVLVGDVACVDHDQ